MSINFSRGVASGITAIKAPNYSNLKPPRQPPRDINPSKSTEPPKPPTPVGKPEPLSAAEIKERKNLYNWIANLVPDKKLNSRDVTDLKFNYLNHPEYAQGQQAPISDQYKIDPKWQAQMDSFTDALIQHNIPSNTAPNVGYLPGMLVGDITESSFNEVYNAFKARMGSVPKPLDLNKVGKK
jgi:hypothetical protein